jgi:molecular chaperone DnaK (HSP70)
VSYLTNGTILVGEDAISRRDLFPAQTIYNAKRFIGRPFGEVGKDAEKHPYTVVANTSRGPDETEEDAAAGFSIPGTMRTSLNKNSWVSPISVGAEVIRHMMKSVDTYLGYPIHRAVICVPAKFSPRETAATVKAFNEAGIKVMRVLEEPTAAAIAYNLHKGTSVRHVLVYDIGGGTLDTSLLYMNGKTVNVLGVAGDDRLGGSDFDHRMQALIEAKLNASEFSNFQSDDPSLAKCSPSGLGVPAERAKIALSANSFTEVRCEDDAGKGRLVKVTRAEFEKQCQDLFDRAVDPVKRVLDDQMMGAEAIDDVVLVGGASRMPQLRDLIRKFFSGKRLHTEIDPDVTVAYGAANVVD